MKKEKRPFDVAKVRKGHKIATKDGREGHVIGMYLGANGPVLMVKSRAGQITADNVPADEIDGEIVEG